MIRAYVVISLLAMYMMYIYYSRHGYDYKGTHISIHPKLTLGNLGSNDAQCHNVMISPSDFKLDF